MKRSIIRDIFNGAKGSHESMALPKKNLDNLDKVSDSYDRLIESFTPEQVKLIDKFLDDYDQSYCDEIDFYFTEGFKLGMQIAVECFQDEE